MLLIDTKSIPRRNFLSLDSQEATVLDMETLTLY